MKVRALDAANDWMFGRGLSDYKQNNAAVAQNIQTRLYMFLGDCFFAIDQGIDWFNLLGGKNQLALNLAVSATILNTEGVTALKQLSISLDRALRKVTIQYEVTTIYTGVVSPTATVSATTNFLLTEGGDVIITEDGNPISI